MRGKQRVSQRGTSGGPDSTWALKCMADNRGLLVNRVCNSQCPSAADNGRQQSPGQGSFPLACFVNTENPTCRSGQPAADGNRCAMFPHC
mmetsp:Transcript_131149/g.227034  ORF Transcript_131149/g.227034 Transcript_131149/m.227034 type:complete len:90 (+) Transcript_131149:3799-4068(+)